MSDHIADDDDSTVDERSVVNTPASSRTSSAAPPLIPRARNLEVRQDVRLRAQEGFGTQLGNEVVDLFVGPTRERFTVHKSYLTAIVPYFHEMFVENLAEAQPNSASFPEDVPAAFELFIEWMYTGDIRCVDSDLSRLEVCELLRHRLHLYALADKLGLPNLADFAMTVIACNLREYGLVPGETIAKLAYDLVQPDSPLLEFIAQSVHYSMFMGADGRNDWQDEGATGRLAGNPRLLQDVLALFVAREQDDVRSELVLPSRKPLCDFHLHEKDEECEYSEWMV